MKINGKYTNLDGRVIDHFDLEQKIMEAWHIVDDLRLTYERIETMDEDQLYGAIHGLEIFASMRFESLCNTFEQCIHNGVFDDVKKRRAQEIIKTMDEATESLCEEEY